jgi:uncharacterized phage protein (TIGR01671 family)
VKEMKHIKFRAWDGEKMITPYSIRNGMACIIKPCNPDDKVITDDGIHYYCNWDIDVATDWPVMQFTGLLDSNGVEIYEGDIVKNNQPPVNFIVRYICDGWCLDNGETPRLHDYIIDNGSVEVIGNIHHNPELLK